ncbi:MAG: carboxypeptidase regulatory-like domain-containing protein [Pelatocladus maniniholoensis HA4357-MV3]|jgi:hypothetical protein|uniref:Carboxypeptidase regulatory-like domain-containing protein n=1 Tax=Pelatocladus maniniholoensis HA4357-MV3 TaxID=1117104 RepID=A0A9E3H528_9NOST|nr:carboxypeptidase regulatory-like domain-containing protein [Pelatocladus maniniholoensis HA4357-MV3]
MFYIALPTTQPIITICCHSESVAEKQFKYPTLAELPSQTNKKNNDQLINNNTSTLAGYIKTAGNIVLVGVIINGQEVGNIDIRLDGNTILVPLKPFADIANFTIENTGGITKLKTPLGVIDLTPGDIRQLDGVTYISDFLVQEKLLTKITFDTAELALVVDLPWRKSGEVSQQEKIELQPEIKPPSSTISSLRQELYLYKNSGDTSFYSSTLLGGRLAGGAWRVRLNNNFKNMPNLAEYFFYKRQDQLRYQIGRQQIGLHPLLNSMTLTGAQIGITNLPADRFNQSYNASELLPRRSQPLQTFKGKALPASFVQLRLGGIVIAQQQVGLNGTYEFLDVNVPTGSNDEIELLVYDRNNLSVPIEIRPLSINTSNLLLPAGGNVQLAGLGLSGNVVQDAFFDDFGSDAGKLVGFYQFRQGFSRNFTFESALQLVPDNLQAQAGFVWQPAIPAILTSSVGTSRGKFSYATDLDVDFGQLEILGNSQLFPSGYSSNSQSRDRYNHSLRVNYRFSNAFNLGFIARSFQNNSDSVNYISPTFNLLPFRAFSLSGRPDYKGRYLFNAFYNPTSSTRLAFSSFGDIYNSSFNYNFNRQYQLSLGSEFGGDQSTLYSAILNHYSRRFGGLNWRMGIAYSNGEIGPVIGAGMQVLPGLYGRVDYQAIPSRIGDQIGAFGNDRLTVSLISDLSFAGGSIAPSRYYGLGQEKGGIAGRILIEGEKKKFNLEGANIRVVDSRNDRVGGTKTDAFGNFFIGNLPEGVYVVEIDPDKLPVELSTIKTSIVAEVAGSAVTRLDFPVREEYGVAGKITDAADQPISEVQVELINADGKRVASGVTDEFGFYRFDNVPVGKYTINISKIVYFVVKERQ